jgi:hypothetical protein
MEQKEAANARAPFIPDGRLVKATFQDDGKEFDEFDSQLSKITMSANLERKQLARKQAFARNGEVGEDEKKAIEMEIESAWTAKMLEANQVLLKADQMLKSLPRVTVPFSKSKAWTLIACLHIALRLCKDLRRLLYTHFVAAEYGAFANEQVKRVIGNREWFVSLPVYQNWKSFAEDCWFDRVRPFIPCLDEKCKAKANMRSGAIRSKICFESWLTEHFFVTHQRVPWETFCVLSPVCAHKSLVETSKLEYLVVDTVTMRTRTCIDCGKIVAEDMEI